MSETIQHNHHYPLSLDGRGIKGEGENKTVPLCHSEQSEESKPLYHPCPSSKTNHPIHTYPYSSMLISPQRCISIVPILKIPHNPENPDSKNRNPPHPCNKTTHTNRTISKTIVIILLAIQNIMYN